MQFLNSIAEYLLHLNWPALVQGIGSIWVAIVATLALETWRRQLHAQKQTEFIEQLTDTVHEFIQLMSIPIGMVEFTKTAIHAYKNTIQANEFTQFSHPEAIAFIQNRGEETSRKILEKLNDVRPALSKMQSLVVKGQVFAMNNYAQCQNACDLLKWSHDQIEAFCVTISFPHLNWENRDVQKSLDNLHKINPSSIKQNLAEQNQKIIIFARNVYENTVK